MPIMIRNVESIRETLDEYKAKFNCATDTKAIDVMVRMYFPDKLHIERLENKIYSLEEKLDKYEDQKRALKSALKPFLK